MTLHISTQNQDECRLSYLNSCSPEHFVDALETVEIHYLVADST